jgi:hypothetical protein
MATTNYYTVNSEIIGELTAGQSRLDHLPDALGSWTVRTWRHQAPQRRLAGRGFPGIGGPAGPMRCYGGITDQKHAGQEDEIRAGRKACLQAMVDSRCFLP